MTDVPMAWSRGYFNHHQKKKLSKNGPLTNMQEITEDKVGLYSGNAWKSTHAVSELSTLEVSYEGM